MRNAINGISWLASPEENSTQGAQGAPRRTAPVFFMRAAMYVVLPAGAAAMSTTLSPSWGASAMTGMNEDAPCTHMHAIENTPRPIPP